VIPKTAPARPHRRLPGDGNHVGKAICAQLFHHSATTVFDCPDAQAKHVGYCLVGVTGGHKP